LPGGRDIVAGARAVCRARRRTRERGEGEKRPLLFIAQKVKIGDFTVIENWSSHSKLFARIWRPPLLNQAEPKTVFRQALKPKKS
jgi:hypothetical protein